ncbi:hypothetical protein IU500_13330 [Nocardia terpenica]|uniref:hypothetical protein n=1 Tax=Nocardia terpenica TaxID=455432 RepID=UPI0018959152|nr:hypothetical protein [Nocardia terpenica]MBF6062841.1 hypothetical protein [Nocardia terpenica]MBF6105024.1 hypothetical protein [Nocardia terpenica]MBF6112539.1 hypothetical protein [Nocardia terpenica]MBF6118752.1 hypothetical protein [Nocardia terpenica]MBF6154221.1 hypothetical protein [Nocardia terpenica]
MVGRVWSYLLGNPWLAVVLGIIGIGAGAVAWVQPDGLQLGNVASWASAIGTFTAITVALWQARQSRSLADRDRLDAYRQLQRTQLENRKLRTEDSDERSRTRLIDILVQLLEAWDIYHHNTDDYKARAQVRALISALPGYMARVAGIEVQVPREPYRQGEFQPIHLMYWPGHAEILKDHLARLEIEHNLKQIRGDADCAFKTELLRYIASFKNPYNLQTLSDEQREWIQKEYEAIQRGEPSSGASVTNWVERDESADGRPESTS